MGVYSLEKKMSGNKIGIAGEKKHCFCTCILITLLHINITLTYSYMF